MTVTALGSASSSPQLAGSTVAVLRGIRRADGTVGDLAVRDGQVVADVSDAGEGVELDASGWRAVPAGCEPHAHLDKALSAARLGPTRDNDLMSAIEQWCGHRPLVDAADVYARGSAALARYAARGITAVRTHVDLPTEGDPFRGVDALVALREEVRDRITLQVCLLYSNDTPDDVLFAAAARGVDVIGGCPHIAPDPKREITRALDVAERHGLPVDLHCDEQTSLPADDDDLDVVQLARQVLDRGHSTPVTASHAVRLGMLPPDRLAPVVELLARARIGVVTLPITNLYLMGRDFDHAMPRGLTAVRALLDGGVTVAAGGDNLRDPFNPAGRADPFETTSLLMTAAHLRGDEALHAVTAAGRQLLGLPPAGTAPGETADLVLLPDEPLGDVLAGAVDTRIVLRAGMIIAETRVASAVTLDPTPLEVP
ncbi:amidohydrolase family protein [Pseudonocardia sp. CA-107938]|uniref:amidohydrolase family protein n=1 Tax=Pseudonocardia sp. CA-107938 TaxID=3240021 RepID=UPI003D950028